MENISYNVIGVMSGTSLDGIDLALVNFQKDDSWKFEVLRAETIPYSQNWKKKLSSAINLNFKELEILDREYTQFLTQVILEFANKDSGVKPDAICSHGHTIKHEPHNGFTLQIGNLPLLSELLDKVVVCDFRVQDVELGGQGAPLVPIGDDLLFSQYKYCVNLGGFANISTRVNGKRIAYDICAVNTVLNYYAEKMGKEYDEEGKLAESGTINTELLQKLEELEYYKQAAPKSLGIEWVNAEILPVLSNYEENIASILNTFCQHIALQITQNLDNDLASEVLITGGGCFNSYLIQQIQKNTECKIIIPSAEIVNFKEAIIFGFLGVLRLNDEINVLSSVTGAKVDHSSGVIFGPENF